MSLPRTPSERQKFWDEYDHLTSLLASWTVADGESDEEILAGALNEDPPESLQGAVEQGRKLLRQKELPWRHIVSTSNRHQPTEAATREWLTWILDRVEAFLAKTNRVSISAG